MTTRDNEQMIEGVRKRLRKSQERTRGYPVATVPLYSPDDTRATKLTVGIVPAEDADATHLRRWFAEEPISAMIFGVTEEVLAFIDASGVRSIVMTDRIIGCLHEEASRLPSAQLSGVPVLGCTRSLDWQAPTLN
jgi:hypothetical protein